MDCTFDNLMAKYELSKAKVIFVTYESLYLIEGNIFTVYPSYYDTNTHIYIYIIFIYMYVYTCIYIYIYIYICYMAAPQPTLGQYWADSLTHPMLITVFWLRFTRGSPGLMWFGSGSLVEHLMGFKPGTFQSIQNHS